MEKQKVIAIVGRNGSGKTRYVDQLRKSWASDSVRYIAFDDAYGSATDKSYYLQLRWNQHDIDAETATVGQLLERAFLLTGSDTAERRAQCSDLLRLFHLDSFLDKYIILLSSGELRKFQLVKTLLANPKTIILDNPFIGLDAETRSLLKDLLLEFSVSRDITIYLVLSKSDDIPDGVDTILYIDQQGVATEMTPAMYADMDAVVPQQVLAADKRQAILDLPAHDDDFHAEEIIRMNKVNIRYGERTILKDVDWTVRNGERWSLSGQNGSGKSTLLSLVCADNPQSYACDITLFGYQRGSGESIWDIKHHIGYV